MSLGTYLLAHSSWHPFASSRHAKSRLAFCRPPQQARPAYHSVVRALLVERLASAERGKAAGAAVCEQHARLRAALAPPPTVDPGAPAAPAAAAAVWGEFMADGRALKSYAASMEALAKKHWAPTEGGGGGGGGGDRIEWVVTTLRELREEEEEEGEGGEGTAGPLPKRRRRAASGSGGTSEVGAAASRSCRLLDVGSCYDPFRRYPGLAVTALDLCPSEVLPALLGRTQRARTQPAQSSGWRLSARCPSIWVPTAAARLSLSLHLVSALLWLA